MFICEIIIRGDYNEIFASLFWLGVFDLVSIFGLEKGRRYFVIGLLCVIGFALHEVHTFS